GADVCSADLVSAGTWVASRLPNLRTRLMKCLTCVCVSVCASMAGREGRGIHQSSLCAHNPCSSGHGEIGHADGGGGGGKWSVWALLCGVVSVGVCFCVCVCCVVFFGVFCVWVWSCVRVCVCEGVWLLSFPGPVCK